MGEERRDNVEVRVERVEKKDGERKGDGGEESEKGEREMNMECWKRRR